MSFEEYMSEVLQYKRISLSDADNRSLKSIMGEPKSAYRVFSFLKDQGYPIAYKNVHSRIKRLENDMLIEKNHGKFKRRAIKYQLTTQGLFYLLSQFIEYKFGIYWSELWQYYSDNIIIKTLVLPYFEIETLMRAGFNLSSSLLSYLRQCYQITLDGRDYIKQIDQDDYTVKSAIKSLKRELELEAKEMAFSLMTRPKSTFGVSLAIFNRMEIKRTGKTGVESRQLGRDKRFMKLLREVKKDFDQKFNEAVTISKEKK
jgi:DNA-binding PadR family transcriptional regulator